MRCLLAAVAGLVFSTSLASAKVFDWTGFYVGIHAGQGTGHMDRSLNSLFRPEGQTLGLQFGYNLHAHQNFVIGLEADYSGSSIEDWNGLWVARHSINYLGSVRGRFGFVNDRILLYVTGGYAFGILRSIWQTRQAVDHHGFAAGAGIEYALTDRWSLRFEYIHYNLNLNEYSVGYLIHVGRFGFNFRF